MHTLAKVREYPLPFSFLLPYQWGVKCYEEDFAPPVFKPYFGRASSKGLHRKSHKIVKLAENKEVCPFSKSNILKKIAKNFSFFN